MRIAHGGHHIADSTTAAVQPRLQFAHALRGLAALSVVCFHYLGVFWYAPDVVGGLINAPAPAVSRDVSGLTWVFAPRPFVNVGHFGVALFFLISGFVIPWSFVRQTRLGFAASRVLRLWPTYAAGLTCTLLFIGVDGAVFGRPFPYSAVDVVWHYALGLRDLAGTANIDGIVWTLEIEVRFYALCLAIAPWLRRGDASRIVLTTALVALVTAAIDAAAAWHLGGSVRILRVLGFEGQGMVYMLIGTLYHLRLRGTLSRATLTATAAATAAACAGLWWIGPESSLLGGVVTGYGAALAVFSAAFALRDRAPAPPIVSWIADISYPLYAVHAIPGYVLMRLMSSAGAPPWVCVAVALAWAFGAAALIHRIVEEPSHDAGRRWARRLGAWAASDPVRP